MRGEDLVRSLEGADVADAIFSLNSCLRLPRGVWDARALGLLRVRTRAEEGARGTLARPAYCVRP